MVFLKVATDRRAISKNPIVDDVAFYNDHGLYPCVEDSGFNRERQENYCRGRVAI
jgi:hypothetical protein